MDQKFHFLTGLRRGGWSGPLRSKRLQERAFFNPSLQIRILERSWIFREPFCGKTETSARLGLGMDISGLMLMLISNSDRWCWMAMGSDGQLAQAAKQPLLNPSCPPAAPPAPFCAVWSLLSQTRQVVKTQNKKKDRPLFNRGARNCTIWHPTSQSRL